TRFQTTHRLPGLSSFLYWSFRDYGCGKATSFGGSFRKNRPNQTPPGRGFQSADQNQYDAQCVTTRSPAPTGESPPPPPSGSPPSSRSTSGKESRRPPRPESPRPQHPASRQAKTS